MKLVFKSQQLENSFDNFGFAVKNDFLSATEIIRLLDIIKLYHHEIEEIDGFATSTDSKNLGFREVIRNSINEVVNEEKINEIIEGYCNFYSNLLVKKATKNSEMRLHTDWSITDESQFRPLQIWIPLVDVNKENGTLGVIPGSQKLSYKIRGLNIDEPYIDYINKNEKLQFLHFFEVKAGTAVFYHPGIMHYSPPNLSKDTRLAILVSLHPKACEPILYFKNKSFFANKVNCYKLREDFFNTWDKKSKPKGLILKNILHNSNLKFSTKEQIYYLNYLSQRKDFFETKQ